MASRSGGRPSVPRRNVFVAQFKLPRPRLARRNLATGAPETPCGPIQVGTSSAATRAARPEDVGRRPPRRRPPASERPHAAGSSPRPPGTRTSSPRARHFPRAARVPFSSFRPGVRCPPIGDRQILERRVSRRSLLCPGRSRARDCRGRRQTLAIDRNRRLEDSNRTSAESHLQASRRSVERQISRGRRAHAAGNPGCAALRATELEEAHPRSARRRRSLVGTVVRRLDETAKAPADTHPGRATTHVARLEGMARTWRRSAPSRRCSGSEVRLRRELIHRLRRLAGRGWRYFRQ